MRLAEPVRTMSIFQRLGAFFSRFFASPTGKAVVKEAAPVVVSAVEGAAVSAAASNPAASAVVQGLVIPAIDSAVSHIEQPKDPG